MAGRAVQRGVAAEITARAAAEHNGEPLDYICDWIAAGQSLSALARDCGVTQPTMSRYANGLPGAKERIREARADGAHAMVDYAHTLLEDCDHDRDSIALAKARVELITWQAERINQTEFGGAKQQVNVQVNVGNLSLDAMRARSVDAHITRANQLAAGESAPSVITASIVSDAIVLSDDESTT